MNETQNITEPKKTLFQGRPATLIIAAVLLVLLIIAFAVLPLTGLERNFARSGLQGINRGQFQGNFNGNNLPNGQNLPQGGQGLDQNIPGGNQNFSGTPRFNANTGFSLLLTILTNVLRWAAVALGILAIVGLWLKKRWGIVLSVIMAVIAFAATLPSLFRPSFLAFNLILNIVILVLAVGVVVFSLLPQTRKATAAV
jgi:magnesium-transporting ATPase (P-type)